MPIRFWERPARVHLIGIGGVGMAGLARLLLQKGFSVSGSDRHPNRLTRDLEMQGVTFYSGHDPANLKSLPDWAIRTPAVGEGNPEVDGLRNRQIPLFVRGQVLAAFANTRHGVAIAGAHGKTTTTAMLAAIVHPEGAGYAVGGETALPGGVADAGTKENFVYEADESDGTLAHYAPEVGVLTHVEWDHVERFRCEDALLQCYRVFAQRCGQLWIKEGDLLAEQVCKGLAGVRRVGDSGAADLRLMEAVSDPEGQQVKFCMGGDIYSFRILLPGHHNAWNALMAVAAAAQLGISPEQSCEALQGFKGVARRFQIEERRGIRLIQDYAHHPTEIRAVMESARALKPKRLWVVFQPHRFSRTRHLLREFSEALQGVDRLALLPVYAASEVSTQGVGTPRLAEVCRECGQRVELYESRFELQEVWVPELQAGDVVLILGAGDVEALQSEMTSFL